MSYHIDLDTVLVMDILRESLKRFKLVRGPLEEVARGEYGQDAHEHEGVDHETK